MFDVVSYEFLRFNKSFCSGYVETQGNNSKFASPHQRFPQPLGGASCLFRLSDTFSPADPPGTTPALRRLRWTAKHLP